MAGICLAAKKKTSSQRLRKEKSVAKEGWLPAPGGSGQRTSRHGLLHSWLRTKITQQDGLPWRGWNSAAGNCGLFTPLQPSRHKATSTAKKKKKKRSLSPLLEDEGIFALIPKQTHLMPLNTRWHYWNISFSCCCMQSTGGISELSSCDRVALTTCPR